MLFSEHACNSFKKRTFTDRVGAHVDLGQFLNTVPELILNARHQGHCAHITCWTLARPLANSSHCFVSLFSGLHYPSFFLSRLIPWMLCRSFWLWGATVRSSCGARPSVFWLWRTVKTASSCGPGCWTGCLWHIREWWWGIDNCFSLAPKFFIAETISPKVIPLQHGTEACSINLVFL